VYSFSAREKKWQRQNPTTKDGEKVGFFKAGGCLDLVIFDTPPHSARSDGGEERRYFFGSS
jgi:hypothetical protein